ncbi:unnamed protein product [Phaeothamnion confervicola]
MVLDACQGVIAAATAPALPDNSGAAAMARAAGAMSLQRRAAAGGGTASAGAIDVVKLALPAATCNVLVKAVAGCVACDVGRVHAGGGAVLSPELKATAARWAVEAFLSSAAAVSGGGGGSGSGDPIAAETRAALGRSCAAFLIGLVSDTALALACSGLGGAIAVGGSGGSGPMPAAVLGRAEASAIWGAVADGDHGAELFRIMADERAQPRFQACAYAVLSAVASAVELPPEVAAAATAVAVVVAATVEDKNDSGGGDAAAGGGANAAGRKEEKKTGGGGASAVDAEAEGQRDAELVSHCLPSWLLEGLGGLAAGLERVLSADDDEDDDEGDGDNGGDYDSDEGGSGAGGDGGDGGGGIGSGGSCGGDSSTHALSDGCDAEADQAVPLMLSWLLLMERRPLLELAVENVWAGLSAFVASRLGMPGPLVRTCAHFLRPHMRGLRRRFSRAGALERVQVWRLDPRRRPGDMAVLALVAFRRTLHAFPALVRAWWSDDCERRLRPWVEATTQEFVSPAVVQHESDLIAAAAAGGRWDPSEMTVRASRVSREVTATYVKDECALEVTVKLPPTYPLRNVEVQCTRRLGIPEARWRRWVLQIVTLLSMQDGTVLDAVLLWKRNVDKEFEGLEPCVICYSILHPRDMALPSLECRQCKNKFHSRCLYTWFQSSHKSKCPLCQQPWA